jgi:hypothetical protein
MANPFLTDVAIAGPFPAGKTIAVDPLKPLDNQELNWNWPLVGVPGRIPLPAAKGDGEVTVHIAAEVTAPAVTRTKLQLGAVHPLRLWLNGKEVYKGRPGTGKVAPDQAAIDVELREGANQLLIQVNYRGDKEALYARLLDPQRKLRYPEAKP